jgi:hypothetical protein
MVSKMSWESKIRKQSKYNKEVKLHAELTASQRLEVQIAFDDLERASAGQIKMVEQRGAIKQEGLEQNEAFAAANAEPSITMGYRIENTVLEA